MFITIPSSLANEGDYGGGDARAHRPASLELDLQAVAAAGDAADLGAAGFSALSGFGIPGADAGGGEDAEWAAWVAADGSAHQLAVLVLLTLAIAPDGRKLERAPLPTDAPPLAPDLVAALHRHLCCAAARPVATALLTRCQRPLAALSSLSSLLRLLCAPLLDARAYAVDADEDGLLGSGAFGRVVSVPCPGAAWGGPRCVAVKVCRRGDARRVFEELTALRLSGPAIAPRLIEFGFEPARGDFWLVMEQCDTSLKAWRLQHAQCPPDASAVVRYLRVFRRVVDAAAKLAGRGIVHLDLKCDNVLLRGTPGSLSAAGGVHGGVPGDVPEVCIGDFGEACVVDGAALSSGVRLQQARGTECVQSPEMLLVHSSATGGEECALDYAALDSTLDSSCDSPLPKALRQGGGGVAAVAGVTREQEGVPPSPALQAPSALGYRREYVGFASDVWSLGCLLFELLTGAFLFDVSPEEGGWSRLFVLLTRDDGDLFLDRKLAALRALPLAALLERLLRAVLVRNPDDRPSVAVTLQLVDDALAEAKAESNGAAMGETTEVVYSSARHHELASGASTQAPVDPPVVPVDPVDLLASRVAPPAGTMVWVLAGGAPLRVAHCPMPCAGAAPLTLPEAWMETTLAAQAAGSWRGLAGAVPVLLGTTHLVRLLPVGTGDCASASAGNGGEGGGCLRCGTPCEAEEQLSVALPLTAGALDAVTAFVGAADLASGRALIFPDPGGDTGGGPGGAALVADLNGAATALAVAITLRRQAGTLYSALLDVRSAHAGASLSRAHSELIMAWQ